jgi:hypothetical protein
MNKATRNLISHFEEQTGINVEVENEKLLVYQDVRFDALLTFKIGKLKIPFWMDIAGDDIDNSIRKAQYFPNILIVGKLKQRNREKLEKLNISYIADTKEYFIPLTISQVNIQETANIQPTIPKKQRKPSYSSSLGMTKLIFALLSIPKSHEMTQKQIASLTGLSPAIVNRYIKQLENASYLVKERHRIRLLKVDRIIDQWVFEFEKFILPKVKSKTWALQNPDILKDLRKTSFKLENGFWSGAKAADILFQSEIPANFIIYSPNISKLIRELRLIPDPKGIITTRNFFWDFDWEQKAKMIVPLPIIFADLINSNDSRDSKVAEKIRKMIHDTI